jgi:hypothetical protein
MKNLSLAHNKYIGAQGNLEHDLKGCKTLPQDHSDVLADLDEFRQTLKLNTANRSLWIAWFEIKAQEAIGINCPRSTWTVRPATNQ